jgi:hypothetical protein
MHYYITLLSLAASAPVVLPPPPLERAVRRMLKPPSLKSVLKPVSKVVVAAGVFAVGMTMFGERYPNECKTASGAMPFPIEFGLIDVSRKSGDLWTLAYDRPKNQIDIILRGSKYLPDWVANSDMLQQLIVPQGDAKVHRGFLNVAIEISKQMDVDLSALIQKYSTAEIHFIGHSLGGALAMLLPIVSLSQGALLQNHILPGKILVTTFGAPAVGNINWVKMYQNMRFKKTTRIVNALDVVPNLLTPLMGYHHYEDELLCINGNQNPVPVVNGSCSRIPLLNGAKILDNHSYFNQEDFKKVYCLAFK